LAVFRNFRRIADALERLASTATEMRENAPALERLDALELSRAQFEADIEGVLMKADSKLKAAANAEARERHQRGKRDQDEFNAVDGVGEEGAPPAPFGDAEAREAERVPPMYLGVAPTRKEIALRAKFS